MSTYFAHGGIVHENGLTWGRDDKELVRQLGPSKNDGLSHQPGTPSNVYAVIDAWGETDDIFALGSHIANDFIMYGVYTSYENALYQAKVLGLEPSSIYKTSVDRLLDPKQVDSITKTN